MSGGFWWHFKNHDFWGSEPDYIYHPDDEFEPAQETEYPGKRHAQHKYFPHATPFHDWKASKFGMKHSDLTGLLWDKYNTISVPILNYELFLLDTSRAADEADTREEFETKMMQRRTERVDEALRCLELAATIYRNHHIREIFDAHFGAEADETQQWKAGFDLFLQNKDISSLAMMFGNLGKIGEKAQERALKDEEQKKQMERDMEREKSTTASSRLPSPIPEVQHWHPTDHELWWDERMWRAKRAKQWRENHAAEIAGKRTSQDQEPGGPDLPTGSSETIAKKHAEPPTPPSESPPASDPSTNSTVHPAPPKHPPSPPTLPTTPTTDSEPVPRDVSDVSQRPPSRKRRYCTDDGNEQTPKRWKASTGLGQDIREAVAQLERSAH